MRSTLRHALTGAFLAVALVAAPTAAQAAGPAAPPTTKTTTTLSNWLAGRAVVSWTPPASGTPTYDVRVSHSSALATRPAAWTEPGALQGITRTSAGITLDAGTVLCAAVRVHLGGATGPWSKRSCAVRAFTTKLLTRTGTVTQVTDPQMWGGKALVAHGRATVALSGVPKGAHVGAVITHPAARGTFRLALGSRVVGIGFSTASDEETRNIAFEADDAATAVTRLSFSTTTGKGLSFPLQGMLVIPPWLKHA